MSGDESPYCCVCDQQVAVRELFTKVGGAATSVRYSIVECTQCTLQFAVPSPTAEELSQHYAASFEKSYGNYIRAEAVKREHFRSKLAEIERHTRSRGRLLDVGCANGYLLSVAQEAGWDVQGVELNPAVEESLPDSLVGKVFFGTLGDYDPSQRFGLITLFDLLEHVPRPRQTLEACMARLEPGGTLAVQVPCVDSLGARMLKQRWYHYGPPSHLTFFARPTINALLDDLGFDVVADGWTRKTFTPEYLWRQISSRYVGGFAREFPFPSFTNRPFGVPMSERLVLARLTRPG